MAFSKTSRPFIRAVAYYTVSALTFVGNVGLAWALVYYAHVSYVPAIIAGFTLQTVVAFFVNRAWTYALPGLNTARGLLTTAVVQTFVLGLDIVGVMAATVFLDWSFLPARIVAGIIAGICAYLLDSRFTFHVTPLRKIG